jgi:hypothetical protein
MRRAVLERGVNSAVDLQDVAPEIGRNSVGTFSGVRKRCHKVSGMGECERNECSVGANRP